MVSLFWIFIFQLDMYKGIKLKTSIEYIANFKTSLDPYNGITILSEDLPKDILEFEQNLKDLIQNVKDNKNLIWIYIDIKKSDFIPIATKFGFTFHSCNSDYILLVKVLKENAIVPNLANHTLGVKRSAKLGS